MLTEQEVARSWSQIFQGRKFESQAFDRAEQLLEELRQESPLRHRLTVELEELRTIHLGQQSCGASRMLFRVAIACGRYFRRSNRPDLPMARSSRHPKNALYSTPSVPGTDTL